MRPDEQWCLPSAAYQRRRRNARIQESLSTRRDYLRAHNACRRFVKQDV
jgi:hypothetical protein